MGLWRAAKAVYAHGEKLDQLVHDMEQLRLEWTDVLDVMKAREERMRKRDRGKIKQTVESDEPEQPPATAAFAGGSKDELRRVARHMGVLR